MRITAAENGWCQMKGMLEMPGIVQWIKIVVDLFEDEKILLLETFPNADSIILLWIKLLCLAGKQNNKGVIMFNGKPYDAKMLSVILRREETLVSQALKLFEEYGMVEIINGTVAIKNWGKHQSMDKLEASKEYMRNYMREYRKKQKNTALGVPEKEKSHKVNGKVNIKSPDTKIKKDQKIETEQEKENIIPVSSVGESPPLDYQAIKTSFHSICKSLPQIARLTDKRKKDLQAAAAILGEISFEQLFEKVEKSDFLTGQKTDWCSSFDWIIRPANLVKILEGNYDNRPVKSNKQAKDYSDTSKYENLNMEG